MFSLRRAFWISLTSLIVLGAIVLISSVAAVAAPPTDTLHFEPLSLLVRGARFQFILGGSSVPRLILPKLLDWYKQGVFPVDRLVEVFDFGDINEAFAASIAGTAIKPVIRVAS